MPTLHFTDEDLSFIANALRTAANKYLECERQCREAEEPALANLFADQAVEARDKAGWFE